MLYVLLTISLFAIVLFCFLVYKCRYADLVELATCSTFALTVLSGIFFILWLLYFGNEKIDKHSQKCFELAQNGYNISTCMICEEGISRERRAEYCEKHFKPNN